MTQVGRENLQKHRIESIRISDTITNANMHKFVVKLCNNWLPVSQRLIKYGSTYDHCSLCRQHESYDHVLCCQSRKKWRDSFLSSVDEEMKKWLTAADIRREIVT
jgi:hypothetical protein